MRFSRKQQNLVATFRGLPTDYSCAYDRPVRSSVQLVDDFLSKHIRKTENPAEVIMGHWRDIVGEEAAHRCAPVRILPGQVLVIQVPNSVLRQELLFKQNKILAAIRKLPGCSPLQKLLLR